MKRLSPSQSRVCQHVYTVLAALWIAWRLTDAEGLEFKVGVALLVVSPVVLVVIEASYRRQRSKTASQGVDRAT